jgi:hypothetical protein
MNKYLNTFGIREFNVNYAAGISISYPGSAAMAVPSSLPFLGGGEVAYPVRSAFWKDGAFPQGGDCGSAGGLSGGSLAIVVADTVFSAEAAVGGGRFIS